jgi:Ca2+-binding RTX toxin-like protein
LGDDRLFAKGGDDLLIAGPGADRVFGGDGDDVIFAGAGSDVIGGAGGADLFVLEGQPGVDFIRHFGWVAGDRVLLTLPELQLADGSLDGAKVRLTDHGSDLDLLVDPEGDGSFRLVAELQNAAGLKAGSVLANAITEAVA